MGNQPTKKCQNKISVYKQIQKQQHPYLGTITHMAHPQSTKHILKQFKYTSQQQLKQGLNKAKKRKQLSKKKGSVNILRTTQILDNQNNQLCGITYYLYVIYEDYNANLHDLIKIKNNVKEGFQEEDVVELLRAVSNAIVFLNDHGFKNYAITKDSIVKGIHDTHNNSMYKLFDTELARQMQPYQKLLNNMPIQKGVYLAPEILQSLSSKNPYPEISLKSDIYSLAMVALQMCLLESLDQVYNYQKYTINQQSIQSKIHSLNYSHYLKNILMQMLEPNEEERIGVVTLREKLLVSDNKSTTDYGYSAFGNSNVTQRTHKLSYPNNNIRHNNNDQCLSNVHIGQGQHQRIPRVLTAENLKYQNNQQMMFENNQHLKNQGGNNIGNNAPPIQAINANEQYLQGRKNQTFDSLAYKQNSTEHHYINTIRNKSTDKAKNNFEEPRKRTATFLHSPFYYPQIKPTSLPYHPNQNTLPVFQQQYHHTTHTAPYFIPKNNYQLPPLPSANINDITMPSPMVPLSLPNVTQIQIPQILSAQDKSQPQTPINNLKDSNAFLFSDQLPLNQKRSSNSDDLSVLNSFNVGFKKAISKQQPPILDTKVEYQSPQRPPKISNSYPISNESTPIRKVQALQSHNRNEFNQIIKQSEEQNEFDTNQKSEKNHGIGQGDLDGPKTYGKHHFTSGAVYEGEFDSKGNFCGNGVLYYPSGKVCYSGGWIDNSFHGFGVLNNQSVTSNTEVTNYENFNLNNPNAWHHYQGQFCMDKKNGFGTLYMCNGDKFSGCFVKDLIEGYGTFTNNKGQRISGIWTQNILRKL